MKSHTIVRIYSVIPSVLPYRTGMFLIKRKDHCFTGQSVYCCRSLRYLQVELIFYHDTREFNPLNLVNSLKVKPTQFNITHKWTRSICSTFRVYMKATLFICSITVPANLKKIGISIKKRKCRGVLKRNVGQRSRNLSSQNFFLLCLVCPDMYRFSVSAT